MESLSEVTELKNTLESILEWLRPMPSVREEFIRHMDEMMGTNVLGQAG